MTGRAACVAALCLHALLTPISRAQVDPAQERVSQLIAQLGSPVYANRVAAAKALIEIGAPAVPALEQAARDGQPEISIRAKLILETVGPLVGLDSPDRQKRLAATRHIVKVVDELNEEGNPAGNTVRVFRMLAPAVQVNPDLVNSDVVQGYLRAAGSALQGAAKSDFETSDIGLYLAGATERLMALHPTSPLAGKVLYDAGKFDDYLRQFPQGFYAPRARYRLIAGKRHYYLDEAEQRDWSPRQVRIADADKEIAAWADFLRAYPDFEGADDANYRYARALETKGRFVDACLRLRLRYPDGDMRAQTAERLLFILDARMDAAQLATTLNAFIHDRRDDAELLFGADHLAVAAHYLLAAKRWRDGDYTAAAAEFRLAAQGAQRLCKLRPVPAPSAAPDDLGNWPIRWKFLLPLHRLPDLPRMIGPLATAEAEFADQCAAALAGGPNGDKLYLLASLIYKHGTPATLLRLGASRAFDPTMSSYSASTEPADFHQKNSRYWQSAQLYRKVIDEYPRGESAAKALFMLANCHCHMADRDGFRCEFWQVRQKDNVKKALEYYSRFVKEYPNHELAPPARKAIEFLSKQLPSQESPAATDR